MARRYLQRSGAYRRVHCCPSRSHCRVLPLAGSPSIRPPAPRLAKRRRHACIALFPVSARYRQPWVGYVLSRLLYGAPISLTVCLAPVAVARTVGVLTDLIAGFYGSSLDGLFTPLIEVMLAIPALLLALTLTGMIKDGRAVKLGPFELSLHRGLVTVFLVIGAVSWVVIVRVVRGQVRALQERPFVDAARALGCSHGLIPFHHIMPNVMHAV